MGAPRRTKLTAGAGLATMLVGAMLVVAPTSAGADAHEDPPVVAVVDGKVTVCHRTNSTSNPYRQTTLSVEGANPSASNDHTSHLGDLFDPTATYPTPRSDDAWGDIIPAYDLDGTGPHFFEGVNWSAAGYEMWLEGCAAPTGEQSPEANLTIVKAVTGAIPTDGWSFDFTVTGNGIAAVPVTLTGTVSDVEAATDPALALSPGGYTVTETASTAADFVSWSCSDTGAAEPFLDSTDAEDLAAELTLEDGDDVTCTFTNHFPTQSTPEADVTVIKNVTGAVPPSWAAEVTVDDVGDPVAVPLTGTDAATSDTEDLAVTPGAVTVSETAAGGATLVSGVCTDDEAEPGADPLWQWSEQSPVAQLTLVDGDAVTCTFTNHFASVVIPPQPLPASLEVVKAVTGDVPTGPWSFDFEVDGAGTDEDFELRLGDASEAFTGLTAGAYTITETRPAGDDSTLADVTCRDGDTVLALTGAGDSRTVTLAAGADVTCTFTNDYPEVEDTTVTVPTTAAPTTTVAPTTTAAPTTTEAPAAQPSTEVAGETVVRTLPRTGNETRNLAGIGGALLALGAALVMASRRRLGSIS